MNKKTLGRIFVLTLPIVGILRLVTSIIFRIISLIAA